MSYEFFEFSELEAATWDLFVKKSPLGSIHQISNWQNFQKTIPGREIIFGFGVREKESKKILSTTFCVQKKVGILGKFWYYSARGPVFNPQDKKNKEATSLLIKEISKRLKATGGIFWRIDPYLSPVFDFSELKPQNLKIKKSPQNYQPTNTLEIDLTQTEDQILTQMKRKGRYNINLARKKGIKIETLKDFKKKDIEDFFQLNLETTRRDKFFGHQISYYQNFLKYLKKNAVLFFATYEGKRIATAISTFCEEKFIYYFGASTSDPQYRNLMAPYLLQWEMINFAKKKHCKTYDFLGISPEGEKNHAYSGISDFKWKFGGKRKVYQNSRDIVLNSFWYTLYIFVKRIKR